MCVLASSAGRAVGFAWRRAGSLMHVICILLFQAAGEAGDGYRARRSPHTPHERFEGLTVLKAVQVKCICESAAFLIIQKESLPPECFVLWIALWVVSWVCCLPHNTCGLLWPASSSVTFRDAVRGRLKKCFLFCEAGFGDCLSL